METAGLSRVSAPLRARGRRVSRLLRTWLSAAKPSRAGGVCTEQRSGAGSVGPVQRLRGRAAHGWRRLGGAVHRWGGQHRAIDTARMKGWVGSGGRIGAVII